MTYPPKSGRCMQYREMLFEKGFAEAKQKTGHFFRQATEQTAFVINLEDDEEGCITILYGFASTAYMAGDEEWFANHGSDMDDCQVRNILSVLDDASENNAQICILNFYEQYKNHAKEEILAVKKRKAKRISRSFCSCSQTAWFQEKRDKVDKEIGKWKSTYL